MTAPLTVFIKASINPGLPKLKPANLKAWSKTVISVMFDNYKDPYETSETKQNA